MTSSQTSSGSAAATVLVYVPRETHQVGGLEYVERKPWKYRTEKRFDHSIGDDYAILTPSSKFPKPANAANSSASFITLEVEVDKTAQSAPGHVRRIFIEEGYAWDGASGPTFDTCGSFHAALVHDALYQCMRLGYVKRDWHSRKAADKLFLRMLKRGGMGPLRRQIWYRAVRLFGKKSTMPKPHKGRRYPGIGVLLAGVAGLIYWAYSKLQTQIACLLDDLMKRIQCAWGCDLDTLCKEVSWLGDVLALGGIAVLIRLGFELWKGDSCSPRKRVDSEKGDDDAVK